MALLDAGYWPATYWSSRYWTADYWPEYGTGVVVTPPSTGGGSWYASTYKPVKRPNFLLDNRETLKTFVRFLRWKLGYTDELPDMEE